MDDGHTFLGGCSSITSIDLSGLSQVTNIVCRFLYGCSSVTSIDLGAAPSPATPSMRDIDDFVRRYSWATTRDYRGWFYQLPVGEDLRVSGCGGRERRRTSGSVSAFRALRGRRRWRS